MFGICGACERGWILRLQKRNNEAPGSRQQSVRFAHDRRQQAAGADSRSGQQDVCQQGRQLARTCHGPMQEQQHPQQQHKQEQEQEHQQ